MKTKKRFVRRTKARKVEISPVVQEPVFIGSPQRTLTQLLIEQERYLKQENDRLMRSLSAFR